MYVVLMRSTSPVWHWSGVTYTSWTAARSFVDYLVGLVPDTITAIAPKPCLLQFPIASED
jgi:hypothetical protein